MRRKQSRVGRQKDRVAIWIPKIYKSGILKGKMMVSFKMTINNKAIVFAHNNTPPVWWEHKMNEDLWRFTYKTMDFGGYLK